MLPPRFGEERHCQAVINFARVSHGVNDAYDGLDSEDAAILRSFESVGEVILDYEDEDIPEPFGEFDGNEIGVHM